MRAVTLSILLASAAVFGAAAVNAQTPDVSLNPALSEAPTSFSSAPADPGWSGDPQMPCCDLTDRRSARSLDHGVAALEASDFTQAEEIFANVLRHNKNNTAVRFYLGVAKMNLGKWDEAKRYLKTAARELRKLPDPKSHLGVTYAKLGDIDAAHAQRARLVKMAEACKSKCELSPYIIDGIEMIDEALAESPSSSS